MTPRAVGVATALVLHAVLLVMLSAALRSPRAPAPTAQARLIVRTLPLVAPLVREVRPSPRRASPKQLERRPRGTRPREDSIPRHTPIPTPAPALPAPEERNEEASASELLESEATRRAIAAAARAPTMAERAAQASAEPRALRPDERLGGEIARAARGDCLKGEYTGGGMGLLSVPFWLAAELREKCRR